MAEEPEEPAVRRPGSMPAEADDPFGDEPATEKPAPAADDTF